ncbi:hypothetical protein [Paenibacillus sedimenti]|uniref:Uncharacterized protein n=1 Tax=Paenibacillus sedimenti TaxID=2770274 RepID=A0A926KSG4_9BACL|nr:hypothetical protein [Paenibacillus sedimenti]MBD0382488.1 hypothetical protein [Paenibacillus sedimenti]
MSTADNNDVISHAINAAQANADDSESKEQVEQLSSQLNQAGATSQADDATAQQ